MYVAYVYDEKGKLIYRTTNAWKCLGLLKEHIEIKFAGKEIQAYYFKQV